MLLKRYRMIFPLNLFQELSDDIKEYKALKKNEYYDNDTPSTKSRSSDAIQKILKFAAISFIATSLVIFIALYIGYFAWSRTKHLSGKPIRRLIYISMGLSLLVVVGFIALQFML